MASVLNFQARTASGKTIEFAFPLHPETKSVEGVASLVKAALSGIDAEARKQDKVSPSDIVQALAIALSARAAMINAPADQTAKLAKGLLTAALKAAGQTKKQTATNSGTA